MVWRTLESQPPFALPLLCQSGYMQPIVELCSPSASSNDSLPPQKVCIRDLTAVAILRAPMYMYPRSTVMILDRCAMQMRRSQIEEETGVSPSCLGYLAARTRCMHADTLAESRLSHVLSTDVLDIVNSECRSYLCGLVASRSCRLCALADRYCQRVGKPRVLT